MSLLVFLLYFLSFHLIFNYADKLSFTSPMDRIYPDTLSELLQQSKKTQNAIYGNPLLYSECSDALMNTHSKNMQTILSKSGIPTPWFWSRESIDATIKNKSLHRRLKVTSKHSPIAIIPWSTHAAYAYGRTHSFLPHHMVRWYERLSPNITENIGKNISFDTEYTANDKKLKLMNDKSGYMASLPADAHYYHIEKSGSSSMGGTLNKFGGFNRTYLSENIMSHVDCGFTFVREPISRFISGYYTVNKLIFWHNKFAKKRYPIPDLFSFWNISREPHRTLEFIKNLIHFQYDFVVSSPLEHMMSQSSVLSISQLDIHFVGRLSQFKEHFDLVIDHCAGRFMSKPDEILRRMAGFGTMNLADEPEYAAMMSLDGYEDGDLLPAYKAIADSYEAYQSLVEYFRQDFVCFGYEHNFTQFRQKVYAKLQKQRDKKEKE